MKFAENILHSKSRADRLMHKKIKEKNGERSIHNETMMNEKKDRSLIQSNLIRINIHKCSEHKIVFMRSKKMFNKED